MNKNLKLKILKTRVAETRNKAQDLKEELQETLEPDLIVHHEDKMINFVDRFEEFVPSVNEKIKEINQDVDEDFLLTKPVISGEDAISSRGSSIDYLDQAISRCRQIENLLDGLIEPSLSEKKEEELKQVEKEIEEIIRPDLRKYSEDLKESLKEFRAGHFLASSLVCGRIIDVILDKAGSAANSNSTDDKIDYLVEQMGLETRTQGNIMQAIKKHRDNFSHQVDNSPDLYDSMIILMGTTKLLKNILESNFQEELAL